MRIIVDAMGGDYAPEEIIKGTVEAVKEYNLDIILVGKQPQIKNLLDKFKYPPLKINIYPAAEVIEMGESPAMSIRRKQDSSIVKGVNLLKENKAQVFFSAGNTGAVVCAATLILGILPGIERPGIAITLPTLKGTSLVIDVGANIDPKPAHLLSYALMGETYFHYMLNKSNVSVGLLNIGEEASKGTDFVRETHHLLSESHLNFIGNIEATDLFSGKCDVIVCDGFIGNIALKVSEGLIETGHIFFKRHLRHSLISKIGGFFLRAGLGKIKKQIDYSEYGAAPLLGVGGIVLIGHGHSNSKAVKNALGHAQEEVNLEINRRIEEAIGDGSR